MSHSRKEDQELQPLLKGKNSYGAINADNAIWDENISNKQKPLPYDYKINLFGFFNFQPTNNLHIPAIAPNLVNAPKNSGAK